jgi:hypothetical protein
MSIQDDKPWWIPELTDAAWCARIREDYPEDAADSDDDTIRDEYADGWKYADTWDHLGDAREQFEQLADAYFALTAELAKEKHRADSWVKAARELAQSMGFDADENKGSLADWKFITTELAAAQAQLAEARRDAEQLRQTSFAVYDYLLNSPSEGFDLPDEVYVPWSLAISDAAKGEA